MSKSAKARHARSRLEIRLLAGLAIALTIVGVAAVLMLSRDTTSTVVPEAGAPARLVARETTIDLGRVPFDKPVEAQFELANTGADTVRLVGAPRVRMLEGC